MKLARIQIHKYKSCLETELALHEDLTVLIGVNGAGKTNIMTAVNLLSLMSQTHFTMFPADKETEVSFLFVDPDWSVELRVKSSGELRPELSWRMADILDQYVQVPLYFVQSDDVEKNSRAVKNYFDVLNMDISTEKITRFTSRMLKTKTFIESIRYYSAVQFSDVTKVVPHIQKEAKTPREQFLQDLFNMRNDFPEKYTRYRELVGPEEIHLVDDISFKGYMQFSEYMDSGNSPAKNEDSELWMPLVTINNRELRFNQLSEGTFKTLALLFYITAHDGGLLLLEEPEISVHYKLLKDIIEIIKNESENKQILCSTHSDYVLDMLDPEMVVLVKNGRRGTKAAALPSALSEENDQGLRTFLECEGSLGEYWKAGSFDEA
ncbi:MAG: ATP-binding protein [Spirochaetaceae bacterium]|jgi:predicted ATPase|nr:ATP-binding protein [Spirochaetaceae bacterium]